jgi:hypothetical protein
MLQDYDKNKTYSSIFAIIFWNWIKDSSCNPSWKVFGTILFRGKFVFQKSAGCSVTNYQNCQIFADFVWKLTKLLVVNNSPTSVKFWVVQSLCESFIFSPRNYFRTRSLNFLQIKHSCLNKNIYKTVIFKQFRTGKNSRAGPKIFVYCISGLPT